MVDNKDNKDAQTQPHKRRVRYSGTHPKSYKEKYKEHNPEKYADTIERVIQKVELLRECIFLLWCRKYWISCRLSRDR